MMNTNAWWDKYVPKESGQLVQAVCKAYLMQRNNSDYFRENEKHCDIKTELDIMKHVVIGRVNNIASTRGITDMATQIKIAEKQAQLCGTYMNDVAVKIYAKAKFSSLKESLIDSMEESPVTAFHKYLPGAENTEDVPDNFTEEDLINGVKLRKAMEVRYDQMALHFKN